MILRPRHIYVNFESRFVSTVAFHIILNPCLYQFVVHTFKVKTRLLEIYTLVSIAELVEPPLCIRVIYSIVKVCQIFVLFFEKRHQQHKVRKGLPIWFSFLVFINFDWGKTNSLIYYSNSNPWSLFVFFCNFTLKLIYSEKATKLCEIFPLLLTTVHTVKSKVKIFKILWPSQNIWTLTQLILRW